MRSVISMYLIHLSDVIESLEDESPLQNQHRVLLNLAYLKSKWTMLESALFSLKDARGEQINIFIITLSINYIRF